MSTAMPSGGRVFRWIFLNFFSFIFALLPFALFAQSGSQRFSFVHGTGEREGILFFEGEIVSGQTVSSFRRAVRQGDVSFLVLSSPGGDLIEGILFAETVRDLGLNTVVPDGADCASACSFVFFAGIERSLYGRVGVHQFRTESGNSDEALTQWTAGEVIQVLNGFDVPRIVFEKMLQTLPEDMYWFGPEDGQLFSDRGDLRIDESRLVGRELTASIQRELNRLGCVLGDADGIVGNRSRAALREYSVRTSTEYDEGVFSDILFLRTLQEMTSMVCDRLPESAAVDLSGNWSLVASCRRGAARIRGWFSLRDAFSFINGEGRNYVFRYSNDLGEYASGTLRQDGISATLSLVWNNGVSDSASLAVEDNGTRLRGMTSLGCSFVSTRQ